MLVGGQDIHRHTTSLLEQAKKSIDVEMYTFGDWKLADLLIRKARAGGAVRVILDRHSDVNRAMKRYLSAERVPVVFYPTETDAIDHVKLIVVDGFRVVIGGANWGEHSPKNFDVAVEVEGESAAWSQALFNQDFEKSKARVGRGLPVSKQPRGDRQACRIVTDWDIRKVLMDHVGGAKQSIVVALYVLTDREVLSELIDAHRRGLRVNVMLDPGDDLRLNQKAYDRLKKAKVPVKWYEPNREDREKFHIKMVVVDGKMAALGSANYTFRGLKSNHECVIFLSNLKSVQRLQHAFDQVWNRGRQ